MRTNPRRFLPRLLVVTFIVTFCVARAQQKPEVMSADFAKLSGEEIERRLPDEHPANYYLYAGRLWGGGERDKAVFWLYAGQLRFRFHLLANPNLEKSGDPALFGSLQATVGAPINLYVGGDPKMWMSQIDDVLIWDDKTPNGFTSKKAHAKELAEVRSGLVKLRDYVASNQEKLSAQREAEGIGEVGIVNGVYVEERKKKMPKDWPALVQSTSLEMIAGVYEASFSSLLGPILFFEDQYKVLPAKSFVLSAKGSDALLVVAKRGDEELLRRTIKIRQEKGAIVFEETKTAKQQGLAEGGSRETCILRLNADRELVIERNSITEGKYPNKTTPVRLTNINWNRAKRLMPAP
jgi:hypothetical protein